jgi:hypothetical protein
MLIRLAFLCLLQLALSSSGVFAQDATSPCGPVKVDGQLRYPGASWFDRRGEQHFLPDCTTPAAPPGVGQPAAPYLPNPAIAQDDTYVHGLGGYVYIWSRDENDGDRGVARTNVCTVNNGTSVKVTGQSVLGWHSNVTVTSGPEANKCSGVVSVEEIRFRGHPLPGDE